MGNIQFYNEKVLFTADQKVAMHEGCCCGQVTCSCCDGGVGPEEFLVTIDGMAEKAEPHQCGFCENLNDNYVLAYDGEAGNGCVWSGTVAPPVCGVAWITLYIDCTDQTITVEIGQIGPYTAMRWQKDYSPNDPDCVNLSNESLPLVYNNSALIYCDGSSATCSITAL